MEVFKSKKRHQVEVFKSNNKDANSWIESGGHGEYKKQLADANTAMGGPGTASLAGYVPKETNTQTTTGGSRGGTDNSALLAQLQQQYADQALILQQQYERQKAETERIRGEQEAAALKGRDALTQTAQSNYETATTARQEGYDANVGTVNTDTEKALQQAYINSQMQQRNIGQQLAALGRSGGAAESTLLGLANNYGSQRGSLDTQRNNDLAELALALSQGKAEDQQLLNSQLSQYEADYQTQLQNILSGVLGSQSDYETAYSTQLAALQQAQAEQLAQIANSYSSKSSSGSTVDDVKSMFKADLADAQAGRIGYDNVTRNRAQLVELYGQDGYEQLRDKAYRTENPSSRLYR